MTLDVMIADAVRAGVSEVLTKWGTPKLLLTIEEAANMLAYSKDFVLNEVAAGRLHVIGERKAMRIERTEIDRWIAANRR